MFTDGAFAGRLLDWAYTIPRTTLHIVRKPADQHGFVVIPPLGRDQHHHPQDRPRRARRGRQQRRTFTTAS